MMQRKSGNSSGDDIRARLNLAAGRNPPPVELAHVLVSSLKRAAICRRQFVDPRHAVVARGKILDLPMPGENAVAHVEVDEIGIADGAVVLKLPLKGAPAQAAPFIGHRRIEGDASANRVRDHPVDLARILDLLPPSHQLPLLIPSPLTSQPNTFRFATTIHHY